MTKNCPDCRRRLMLLFDRTGQCPIYSAQAPDSKENVFDHQRIDWGAWPFQESPPPNTWVCPRCGHHEDVGQDVIAQQEERPRLFE